MVHSAYDSAGRRKYLNAGENRRFLKSAQKLAAFEASFCLTLYFSGCRISEALSLIPERIDLAGKVIAIKTLKRRDKIVTRRIPIPDLLLTSLRAVTSGEETEPIWNISRTTAWRIVKDVMEDAGIEGIHACPKGLRHSFGVRAAMAKVPITTIRTWMGHSDIETTAIYLDVKDDEERELIRRTW